MGRADWDTILARCFNSWTRGGPCIQESLTLHWDLSPLRNQTRLQRQVTKLKQQRSTPYKRQITQLPCHSDRAKIKADCWGTARHTDLKWLLDRYATTLLLCHYKETFKQWKTQFSNNRLTVVPFHCLNFKFYQLSWNRYQLVCSCAVVTIRLKGSRYFQKCCVECRIELAKINISPRYWKFEQKIHNWQYPVCCFVTWYILQDE